MLRAALGFALVLLGAVRPPIQPRIDAQVLLVIANGVAHGARLANALAGSLPAGRTRNVIADRRLASPDAEALNGLSTVHAPGLAPRSVWRISSFARLGEYLRLRRALGARAPRYSSSRFYDEYVFLAQALRFLLAMDVVPTTAGLMVCDFDRDAYSSPWLWACERLGIPTVTAVHGTPSALTYLPLLAETVLAWGAVQRAWFTQLAPGVRATLAGRPDIASRVPVAGAVERVIICHSREELKPSEATRLADLAERYRRSGVECVLRLHPTAAEPVGAGWNMVAAQCRVEVVGFEPLSESLVRGDFVVGVVTSALIDALIDGYPVAVFADPERPLPADIAAIAEYSRERSFVGRDMRYLPSGYVEALNALSHTLVDAVGEESQERIRDLLDRLVDGDRKSVDEVG